MRRIHSESKRRGQERTCGETRQGWGTGRMLAGRAPNTTLEAQRRTQTPPRRTPKLGQSPPFHTCKHRDPERTNDQGHAASWCPRRDQKLDHLTPGHSLASSQPCPSLGDEGVPHPGTWSYRAPDGPEAEGQVQLGWGKGYGDDGGRLLTRELFILQRTGVTGNPRPSSRPSSATL